MSFLPEGTEIPKTEGNYTRFTDTETKFRVLDSAIVGFELWVDGKPLRRKQKSEFTGEQLAGADINKFNGMKKLPQYFWAFPVWNYNTEKVEILEVTQKSIMNGLNDFLSDPDYGEDPKEYDLIIVKDESTDKVNYRVKAKPPKKMDQGMKEVYKEMGVKTEKLFTGENPFEKGEEIDISDEDMDEMAKMN